MESIGNATTDMKRNGYYSHPILGLFTELLKLFGGIQRVYEQSNNRYLILSASDMDVCIDVYEKEFSKKVIGLFLYCQLCQDEEMATAKIHISAESISIGEKNEIGVTVCLQKICVETDNSGSVNEDLLTIQRVEEELTSIIIDEQLKELIKDKLASLQKVYEENHSLFWGRDSIFRFLNSYYGLLCLFVSAPDIMESSGMAKKVVVPLLGLGLLGNAGSYSLSMNSPMVLAALNIIYDRLDEYVQLRIAEQSQELGRTEVVYEIYNDIFMAKLHQIFRQFLILEPGGELYHAAVPAYCKKDRDYKFQIPVRALCTYDSFQGIRELRFAEKILYEIELRKEQVCDPKEFTIALLGEIDVEPLKDLMNYVREALTGKEQYARFSNTKLRYMVYTKNTDEVTEKFSDTDCYEFYRYEDHLTNALKIQAVLKASDLIMILDHCDLYNMDVEEISDAIVFRQSVNSETYESYFKKDTSRDLNLNCKFMDLYNVVTAWCWKGRQGRIKRTAKENLLKYIQNYISTAQDKTCYIYVSDIKAFEKLPYIQKEFVRIEKYHQKEIGLIRLTTHKKEEIPVKAKCADIAKRNIMVFNMWQVVKHLLIDRKDEFKRLLIVDHCEKRHFLDEIYVGIDYTNWKDKLEIFLWVDDETAYHMDNIRALIQIFFQIISRPAEANMYSKYVRKAAVSFLYGAAQSVEDLIFLHILKQRSLNIGKQLFGTKDQEIKSHYNYNCKYSFKKSYWLAAEKLDREAISYVERYKVTQSVERADDSLGTQDYETREFLQNILNACHNIDYDDSRLYIECERLLSDV